MIQEVVVSRYTAALVRAHQYQGQSNDCGPYAAAIVLRALKKLDLNAAALAEEMNRIGWRAGLPIVRRIPDWATFPWGITSLLRDYDLLATWHFFGSKGRLRRLITCSVVLPIYGEWRPFWAHVAVLVAYHPQKGWGFVDSARPKSEVTWIDDHTFTRRWRSWGNLYIVVRLF